MEGGGLKKIEEVFDVGNLPFFFSFLAASSPLFQLLYR